MEATLDAAITPRSSETTARTPSRTSRRVGLVLSGLSTLFLLVDGAMKLARPAVVIEGSTRLGLSEVAIVPLGIVLLACVALYVVPRTAVLGAILLTGYLGGAVAMHVRMSDPWLSHTLFPVYFGVLIWGGLVLRDARVRDLFVARPRRS